MSEAARDDELEALLFECLERIEREGWSALDAVCAAHPSRAAALRDSLAALRGAGLVEGPTGAPGDSAFPERLGEFRLVRRLGGGGMGVVFLAEQPSLGRDVALKLIRPDQLYFPNTRERFQREIEAIARLAHPGIVQVHSVGEDKGIPFYAMEHVPGLSLADVIAAFAGRRPEELDGPELERLLCARDAKRPASGSGAEIPELFVGPWTQVAARIARRIARAVEHAHERGVLHRDLKPSNVMLTPDGRVVLLDFGLASLMGADRLTRTGSQLGSLPYMAPEQLRGDVAAIGPAVDVYAIGVTTYELLTLTPAYEDDTNSERLRNQILDGRIVPVRQLNRSVSRDLATVVAHAMAPEVNARYATVRALADDLDAIVAARPIAARPPSTFERVAGWARRSPARATATALAVALLVGGPSVLAWQQYRANQRVSAVNQDLSEALAELEITGAQRELQRAAAERNLRKAVDVVDTMLTRVAQESLRDVPQMTPVRRDLLQDALAFYEGFLAEREGDGELRRKVALARVRVASVRAVLGETAEVERELAVVIEDARRQDAEEGADPELLSLLARAQGTRSEALVRLGRGDEALQGIADAIATLARVPLEAQGAQYHLELAGHHDKRYEVLHRRGDHAGALIAAEQAVELSRRGLERWPDFVLLELGLGRQLDHVGCARLRTGRAEDSLEAMLEAVRTLERYHVARPGDAQGREKLMAARINTANTLNSLGRAAEAEDATRAAVELGEALVREYPDVPSYRGGYALALNQSCYYAFQRGDLDGAAEVLGNALAQQEVIVQGRPSDVGLRVEMAGAYGNLANVQLERGELAHSLECADRGLVTLAEPLARAPQNRDLQSLRRGIEFNRGRSLVALGRHAEAAEQARRLDPRDEPLWLVNRAQLLERSARLAAAASDLAEEERGRLAESLRTEALADLTRAVELGHSDWSELGDPDEWTSLRGDPRFVALTGQ